ncbi:MAG TPA: nucleotidyltransferase domain-containing protein [Candidatus Nanoarchaeia archaeon]|nr:nucleotidyltransferase domain-containing protein [Candidatus Nanoarchaeia archaeon]
MYQKRNKELEIISLYTGDYKARFYLRQIAKLSKLPLKTCQNVLARLEENKMLRNWLEGRNKYFSLNLDNIQTKSWLLQAEIHKTDRFIANYPEIKTFLKAFNTNSLVIVFGSFARLKADKNSDMDLLVVSEKEKLPYHLLPYKAHQIDLSEDAFINGITAGEALMKEVEKNHIILNNHSLYINIVWGHYGK